MLSPVLRIRGFGGRQGGVGLRLNPLKI